MDVLILTRNSSKWLAWCIRAVRQEIPRPRIIALDHQSTDGTYNICHALGVEFVSVEKPGTGPARQAGLNAAEGEFAIFIDSDNIIQPGWWKAIKSAQLKEPEAIAWSGRQITIDPSGHLEAFTRRYQWPATSNVLFKVVEFRGFGFKDLISSEDTLFYEQIKKAGLKWVIAEGAESHQYRTLGEDLKHQIWYGRGGQQRGHLIYQPFIQVIRGAWRGLHYLKSDSFLALYIPVSKAAWGLGYYTELVCVVGRNL